MKNDGVNLTAKAIKNKVMQLCIGDIVEIEDEEYGSYLASVERIYPNIVLFRKKNGIAVSLDYFSAAQVNVVKPSGCEPRSEEMAMTDLSEALNNCCAGI